MINKKDLHTQTQSSPIIISGVTVGRLTAEYYVQAYTDIRNLIRIRSYILSTRLRISIPNNYTFSPTSISSFSNYPIAINNEMQPTSDVSGITFELLDYFPKTINTAVSTNQNSSNDNSNSQMTQHSSGSSTSQTNSFDVSCQLGFFGEALTGGMSESAGSSSTTTQSQENTTGSTTGHDSQSGMSASMSIKDWGSYASIDLNNQNPTWLWGQEYPWNVLDFHNTDADGNVILPAAVQGRLYDGKQLYPPSQLSLYGVNFLATAKWLIQIPESSLDDESLLINHSISYYTGTHQLKTDADKTTSFLASIDSQGNFSLPSSGLNLPILGLEPILNSDTGNGAVIGFSPSEFLLPPAANNKFRIISAANNLYATGEGFSSPPTPDGVLNTSFNEGNPVTLTLYFKVITTEQELSLHIKHWKTGNDGCVVNVSINGNPLITRHVDAMNAGSGSDNITVITLRNTNYASEDYYNYITLGLNKIEISISNSKDEQSNITGGGYAIRALAIG